MLPIRKNTVPGALLVLVAATRGASAVPNVTQVIDGLPQVIAPQQIIVQCNPALLPLLCTTALDTVGAGVAMAGQTALDLAVLPVCFSLKGAMDTLRALPGIS